MNLGAKLGCKNLHIEKILTDTTAAYTTDTPIDLSGRLISLKFNPTNLEAKQDADDGVVGNYFATPEGKVTINLTELSPSERAAIFGNTSVGAIRGGGDSSAIPYYLVKYEESWDGGTVYVELLKVKFVPGAKDAETKKNNSLTPQTVTLEGTAVVRFHKPAQDPTQSNLFYEVSSVDPSYAGEGTNWYVAGDNLASPDLAAPTVTYLPIDTAANQLATVNMVWTSDKALLPSTVTTSNFMLVKDTDGSIVAGALSIDTANKVVTFNPTDPLSAGAKYRGIMNANVKTLAGISVTPTVTSFTIAA